MAAMRRGSRPSSVSSGSDPPAPAFLIDLAARAQMFQMRRHLLRRSGPQRRIDRGIEFFHQRRDRGLPARQSRQDLDGLRTEILTFSKTHADAVGLSEKLGADRRDLEAFGERMTEFATLAPALDAKMAAMASTLRTAKARPMKP